MSVIDECLKVFYFLIIRLYTFFFLEKLRMY